MNRPCPRCGQNLIALGVGGLIATGAMISLAAVAVFILLILVCFGGVKP